MINPIKPKKKIGPHLILHFKFMTALGKNLSETSLHEWRAIDKMGDKDNYPASLDHPTLVKMEKYAKSSFHKKTRLRKCSIDLLNWELKCGSKPDRNMNTCLRV